jgi:hypothetical protein
MILMASRRRLGLSRGNRPRKNNPAFTRKANQSPIHSTIRTNMMRLEDHFPGSQPSIGPINRKMELD